MININKIKLKKSNCLESFDSLEIVEIKKSIDMATNYILTVEKIKSINDIWLGAGIPGLFYSFLFSATDASGLNLLHWLVVGDVPSACFLAKDQDPFRCLFQYINSVENRVMSEADNCCGDGKYLISNNTYQIIKRIEFIRSFLILKGDVPSDIKKNIITERLFL